MITQQQVLDLFDYRDGKLFWKKRLSNRVKVGDEVGCKDKHNYVRVGINGKLYWIHRIIFLYHYGHLPEFVDHINLNSLDNRVENLREATKSQNMLNTRVRKDNKTGVKNVRWSQKLKKWLVRLRINTKTTHIGTFDDLELAEFVASEYRDKYHGEFARHG